jgi:hypothetical protein
VSARTGEYSAVDPKSGEPVHPVRSGAEAANTCSDSWPKPSDSPFPPQSKTGRGAGWNPAIESQREALGSSMAPSVERKAIALDAVSADALGDHSIQLLISFFEMLDGWDREAHAN